MPLSQFDPNKRVFRVKRAVPTTTGETTPATTNAYTMVSSRRANNQENVLNSADDWIEKAGSISQAFNKLLAKSACKLCNVYVDEQVEFENRQEDYKTTMAKAWMRSYAKNSMEVELYRQMLFDEESVVDSVTGRDEETTLNAFDRGYEAYRRISDDGTCTTQKSG